MRGRSPEVARVLFDSDLGDSEVHASTAHAGYPESNLLSDVLGYTSLAYGARASQTYIYGQLRKTSAIRTIGSVAAIGTSRFARLDAYPQDALPGTNTARLFIDTFQIYDRRRPPVVSVSLTNLAGSVSDLAIPLDPPSPPLPPSYVQPAGLQAVDAALDTTVTVTFANNNLTERNISTAGPDHRFRVHARYRNGTDDVPDVRFILRQAGADVADLGLGAGSDLVERTSQGWLFKWRPGGFVTLTGSGQVGARIVGTTTGTDTPEILGIEWIAELPAINYDSGSTACQGAIQRWHPDLAIPTGERRYFLIEFSDFIYHQLTDAYPPDIVGEPVNINGLQYVGRVILSPSIEIFTTPEGSSISYNTDDEGGGTRAGDDRAMRVSHAWEEETVEGVYWDTTEVIGATGLKQLVDAVFPNVPVLVSPYPELPELDRWAFVRECDIKYRGVGANGRTGVMGRLFDVSLRFEDAYKRTAPR